MIVVRNHTKQAGPVARFIMGLIFLSIGLVVAFKFGLPIIQKAKESSNWPINQGIITESRVVRKRDNEGKTMYSPSIHYKYVVGSRSYNNNKIYYGGDWSSSSSSYSYKMTNKYQRNNHVTVYYNPQEPSESVLEPGAKKSSYMIFLIGLVFAVIGSLLLLSVVGKVLLVMLIGVYAMKRKRV